MIVKETSKPVGISIVAKNSIYKLKAKRFEPKVRFSVVERLKKLFSIARPSKKRETITASLVLFLVTAVFNTFLLGIGIVAPACWVIKILFGLGLASFNPEFYHLVIYSAYCFPIGLGLALLKFSERHGWFVVLMAGLFGSGLVAPVILGALCKLIIQLALLWILEIEIVSVISSIVYLLLTSAGLINGIYIAIKARDATDWNQSSPEYSAVGYSRREAEIRDYDDIFDSSDNDSDGGDGGDGGD
jgi:hypothetical protein